MTLVEIFKKIKEEETLEGKKDLIRANYSVALAAALKMLFDPTITIDLPAGLPEGYKFNKHPFSSIERIIRSIPPLVHLSNGPKLEKSWLRLIQTLSKDEVHLLTSLKDKDLDIGMTLADVQDIFPSLFQDITPEILAKLDTEKEAKTESKKVDDQGSTPPESSVIPDDPYGNKFSSPVIEEDNSLPSPVSDNLGIIGIESMNIGEIILTAETETPVEVETVTENSETPKKLTPKKKSSPKKKK